MLAVLSVLMLASVLAFGQVELGTIAGAVRDTTGAVVPDATVTITNTATNATRTTTSDANGEYHAPQLTPGVYSVSVTKNGFQTYKSTIEVAVGGHSTLDAQLAVGSGNTVVEVTAGAAGTEVNTQTQELSQLVDTVQMAQLPSLTRNPYDFVALSGNVSAGDSTTPNTMGSQNQTGRGVGYAINGQRESGTEILLDGVENVDLFNATAGTGIPVDAVQEYSVITNNFGAEYGRAAGGVVNLTTKPGTNNWHGSAWEFNRLSAYTANTFNNVANGIPRGVYTRNMFGFQVGGPIIKNKAFVSMTTEWLRVRSKPYQTEEVLDPGFAALLPSNAATYFSTYGTNPVGLAPGSCSNGLQCTTAGDLAAALGLPNLPNINGTTAIAASQPIFDTAVFPVNADAGGDLPQNTYRLLGRLDYNLGTNTQMFFRYGRDREDQFAGTAGFTPYSQYDVGTGILNQSGLFSISHTFNANLLNNTKVSF